jgi:hypothetical protein
MRVKIGDTIYDSDEQPIMIIFDDDEKELISNMEDICTKFCSYPPDSNVDDIIEFMKTGDQ